MIVIDASAMIDLLYRAPSAARIEALLDEDIAAPDALIPEIVRHLARRDQTDPAATRRFEEFRAADIHYMPVWPYSERIWQLRHSVSAYDACYVAIAEALDCMLVTSDAQLGRVHGVSARIVVV
jgi:predicted nucleic acid-binding protein